MLNLVKLNLIVYKIIQSNQANTNRNLFYFISYLHKVILDGKLKWKNEREIQVINLELMYESLKRYVD